MYRPTFHSRRKIGGPWRSRGSCRCGLGVLTLTTLASLPGEAQAVAHAKGVLRIIPIGVVEDQIFEDLATKSKSEVRDMIFAQ